MEIAFPFLFNPEIFAAFTQFIKELGIANHSNRSNILNGIVFCLTFTPIKNQTLCSKIGLQKLLTFVDIGDKKRNSLVESTFTQQNSNQFIEALLEVQKNNNSFFVS